MRTPRSASCRRNRTASGDPLGRRLERSHLAEGMTLIERRQQHGIPSRPGRQPVRKRHTGSSCAAARGSMVTPNHRTLTSAMIDKSRFPSPPSAAPRSEVLAPRRTQDRLHRRPRLPTTIIMRSGDRLDKRSNAKHPRHGAAAWRRLPGAPSASPSLLGRPNRKVPQIAFRARLDPPRCTRPHPSSATTRCSKSGRSGSSSLPWLRHSPPTSPTVGEEARHPGLEVRHSLPRRRTGAAAVSARPLSGPGSEY